MNREFYQSLNEAYASMYDLEEKVDSKYGTSLGGLVRGAQNAAKEAKTAGQAYTQGLFQDKKVSSKARPHLRVGNAVGRVGNKLGGAAFAKAADTAKKAVNWAWNTGREGAKHIQGTWNKTSRDLKKEDAQFFVGAYLLDSGLAETPLAASSIVEHMTDEYLEHLLNQIPEDDFNTLTEGGKMFAGISDEALEKAATASLNKHKAQGYKVPGLDAMDDVVKRSAARKKGQV